MEFVKRYLKKCWTTLVVCMVCQAILYAALFLEGVPADKLWYPMILSAAFAIAYFFFELYRTWHKDGILKQAKQNIDITMENLPEATSVIEQYCDSILQYLRIEGGLRFSFGGVSGKAHGQPGSEIFCPFLYRKGIVCKD